VGIGLLAVERVEALTSAIQAPSLVKEGTLFAKEGSHKASASERLSRSSLAKVTITIY
jgi:hypothetical protein